MRAAIIAPEAPKANIICPNVVQNILAIATPSERNAEAYSKLQPMTTQTQELHGGCIHCVPRQHMQGSCSRHRREPQRNSTAGTIRERTEFDHLGGQQNQDIAVGGATFRRNARAPPCHVLDRHGEVFVIQETKRCVLHVRPSRSPRRCVREPQHRRLQKLRSQIPLRRSSVYSKVCDVCRRTPNWQQDRQETLPGAVRRASTQTATQLQPAQTTTAAGEPVTRSQP